MREVEVELGRSSESQNLFIAVDVNESCHVAITVIDLDTHSIKLSEFEDSRFFVTLETVLIQVLPDPDDIERLTVALVLPLREDLARRIEEVMRHQDLTWMECGKKEVSQTGAEREYIEMMLTQKLNMYLKRGLYLERALDLAIFMIRKFAIVQDTRNHRVFELRCLDMAESMRLDSTALTALHLAPNREQKSITDKEKDQSLLGLIDSCKTKMGSRVLRQWVLQPLIDRRRIEQRLDIVEFMASNQPFLTFLGQAFLPNICDLEKVAGRFFKTKQHRATGGGTISDVCRLYQAVKLTRVAAAFIEEQIETDMNVAGSTPRSKKMDQEKRQISAAGGVHRLDFVHDELARCLSMFAEYTDLVEKHIDMSRLDRGEFVIKYGVSPNMGEIELRMKEKQQNLAEAIMEIEGILECEVVQERDSVGQYILRAPKKTERKLASSSSYSTGLKIVSTRANHFMVSNHKLKSISADIIEIENELKVEQQKASEIVVSMMAAFYPAVETLSELLGQLDALCALSRFSTSTLEYKMTRPIFNHGERILLKKSRHPILDRTQPLTVIANDCLMEENNSSFHVITGPNMGGKSTYIRQVAVNVILAQIGSFCCAEYAELPVFDSVVTRVGAGDAQSKGISTWMSELLDVSAMIASASKRTLLVVDELGRGTSTSEGVGMTYAIAEHIIDKLDSYCLFATHFFELTKLEQARKQVKNYHAEAEFRGGSIVMTYFIKPGQTDKSYGTHILSLLKFPKAITSFAETLASKVDRADFEYLATTGHRNSRPGDEEGMPFDSKVQIIKAVMQATHKQAQSGTRKSASAQLNAKLLHLSQTTK